MSEQQNTASANLNAAAPDMLAMLEALEWNSCDGYGDPCCPVCEEQMDHAADCKLSYLLKRIKGDKQNVSK